MVISVRTVSNASYSTARGVWMVLLTAGLVPTIFRKAFFSFPNSQRSFKAHLTAGFVYSPSYWHLLVKEDKQVLFLDCESPQASVHLHT